MICGKCGNLISVSENELGQAAVCLKCGNPQTVENTPIECVCASCGQALEVESWMEGETAECPACQKPTVLRRAEAAAPEKPTPATPAAPPVPHFRGTPAPAPAPEPPAAPSHSAPAAGSIPHFRGAAPSAAPEINAPSASAPAENSQQAELSAPTQELVTDCVNAISVDRSNVKMESADSKQPPLKKALRSMQRHTVAIGTAGFVLVLLIAVNMVKKACASGSVKNPKAVIQYVKNDDAQSLQKTIQSAHGKDRRATIGFAADSIGRFQTRSPHVLAMLLKEQFLLPDDPQLCCLLSIGTPQGEWIFEALKESGVGFNVTLCNGTTPLGNAVTARNYPLAEKLFAGGANPDSPDRTGQPLIFATLQNPKMLELFLKHGTKLNVRDWKMNTPLCAAAALGQEKSMALLLAQMQDVSQVNDEGDTALLILLAADKKASRGIIGKLLAMPCGINVTNKRGKSAVLLAIERQQYGFLMQLLKAGAKVPADLVKSVKDENQKEKLTKALEELEKANIQEKVGTGGEKEFLPPYQDMLIPFRYFWFITAFLWVGIGLLGTARFAFSGERFFGRVGNVLLLLFGPVMLLPRLLLLIYGKIRFKFSLLAARADIGAPAEAMQFFHLDGSECDFPGEEAKEPKAVAVRMMTELLKKQKKKLLLSPDANDTKVILQGGDNGDVDLPRIDKGQSRKLIRFFKKLAELNVLEESKPQCGRLMFTLDDMPYYVSISTIGMGGNGERAILTVRKGDTPVRALSDLMLTVQERAVLDSFLAGNAGLMTVMAPEGNGRRTFVSLLLDAFAAQCGNAVWIGNGTEPEGSTAVPRVKAELGGGVTFRQMLQALEDYRVVAITYNNGTMPPPEIFDLAGRKIVILLVDAAGKAGMQKLLGRGATKEALQKVLRVMVRPRLVPKLCECATDAAPGPLMRQAWSVLGDGQAKQSAGCPECGYSGFLSPLVLYEIVTPKNGETTISPFPVWTAAKVRAALLAMQGKIAAADGEKVLKGDC